MNWRICRISVAFGLSAAMLPLAYAASPVATSVQQAQSMEAKGDLQGALKVLDTYLKDAPQDADARFTRGLVLTKLNRSDDAIKVFSALTKDYPQLPEPYNNLAVLYAQKGEYDKARDALKAALATHPSYATASENLGDVYAAMAGVAYNHALMLDKNNQQIRYKLSLINKLSAPSVGGSRIASTAPAQTHAAPVAAAETMSSAPPAAQPSAPSVAEPSAPPAEKSLTAEDKAAVRSAVLAWADAWSRQNLKDYFSHYAKTFDPGGGQSHAAWMKERQARVGGPKSISVEVSNLQINALAHDRVRVNFTEDYHSSRFSTTVVKGMTLGKIDGIWKIVRENDGH